MHITQFPNHSEVCRTTLATGFVYGVTFTNKSGTYLLNSNCIYAHFTLGDKLLCIAPGHKDHRLPADNWQLVPTNSDDAAA